MSIYLIDTNVFRHWWDEHYYPRFFPSVQRKFEELVSQKRLLVPDAVLEEVDDICSKPVGQWIRKHPDIVVTVTNDAQQKLRLILAEHQDLVDPERPNRNADAWLIAHALTIKDSSVFSLETPASIKNSRHKKQYYVPDVCKKYGVKCIDFFEFMMAESWSI